MNRHSCVTPCPHHHHHLPLSFQISAGSELEAEPEVELPSYSPPPLSLLQAHGELLRSLTTPPLHNPTHPPLSLPSSPPRKSRLNIKWHNDLWIPRPGVLVQVSIGWDRLGLWRLVFKSYQKPAILSLEQAVRESMPAVEMVVDERLVEEHSHRHH